MSGTEIGRIDPQGVARAALALPAGGDASLRVEDVLLGWVLSLPPETDPARAARAVLARWRQPSSWARFAAGLDEVAAWPRERLAGLAPARRPRG